jgi:bifunctional enzyme CysN/CysC
MTFEKMTLEENKMDIVFVGHVDHGKSTVIGRLLADTGSLPYGKLEQVQLTCKQNSEPFEYAYLIDALKDERAQSITIDSARVFFKSDKRHYIIIDAPGHIEFIKNMVTGASRAEAAVLVIDAHEGVQENSRRHGYLLSMLGIRQIIVVVNKMDLVDYKQDRFEEIKSEYSEYLKDIGVNPVDFIPASGKMGVNLASLSPETPWYKGQTTLEALDNLEKIKDDPEQPFRFPVQDIYKFASYDEGKRIIAGSAISGSAKIGDSLLFLPSGKSSTIKSIEAFGSENPKEIRSGDAAGFTLDEQIYVKRGEVACLESETKRPPVSRMFKTSLFWLGHEPLVKDKQYTLKLGTSRATARVEKIHKIIDANDLGDSNKDQIDRHDIAEVTFILQSPIAFDLAESNSNLSRFVILDGYHIWGGGIIQSAYKDEESLLRDEVYVRNQRWIRGKTNLEDRMDRYNQKPALIMVTGKQHVGRKTLAGMLENQLFQDGKFTYYLGVGSVLYGLNTDLTRKTSENWQEHLRRIAELAYIFLDSGMILIMTAVELSEEDRKLLQTIIGEDKIEVVWIGDDVSTDIQVDLQISGDEVFETSAVKVKQLLQDKGYIFKPLR